jgi:hypothetical protein
MDEIDERRSFDLMAAEAFMPMMMESFHDGLREVGSTSRWLLATLVVINGAAAIALLPMRMPALPKLGAAAALLIGIMAAMGAGLWSLYEFKRVSLAAGTMLSYWLTVAGNGSRVEALESSMKRHMDQAVGSRATHVLLILSVAAFLLGCGFAAWGIFSPGLLR